ncbi:hypothetical protein DRW07_13815 [Alteromonas sediminis]|uniref:Uncharacterized protein n=1 Tax=Alteromonas sediminis TaxID=2259342 RepID=A0A3N5XZE7_9ALTE|nr:hypothetical protein [Alteromonas sediminis]RPJ65883.1 hypothetical protein DRW07_13815 [Alteromonas sediminis]
MKIFHVTSAFVAQRLLNCPTFLPNSALPKLKRGGPGLCCYSFRKGYFLDQETSNKGVKLVLDWRGNVETRSPFSKRPHLPNVLYIEYPWRCYLKNNAGCDNLRILGVLDDHSNALPKQLGLNLTEGWMSDEDYRTYVEQKCQRYLRKYWQACQLKPKYLQVGEPLVNINKQSNAALIDSRLMAAHLNEQARSAVHNETRREQFKEPQQS